MDSLGRISLFVAALAASPCLADGRLEYNRHIRPILAENCFACHGPDSAARKAKLRLDQRDAAIKAGAIVPSKPGESELIGRIFEGEESKRMPPLRTHKKLTSAQKETLKEWIAAGAEYQPHWSLIAPNRTEPPKVKNAAWVRNPIDAFVLAELEKRGLTPAPEADRRTLARRLSLDMIGLPPTPAEVEAFVNDQSADAYEKYVGHLMKSPHWGEHRGRYWLDAARYGDSHGIHVDNYREIWSFRDWVINAFNRNMPFDQFTIEQLGGDLLPKPTLDQRVATGFNRCNITTNEGGAISEEYLVLYTRDRTETFAQVWLGITANCATCHDHKFDPLTMRDFYALSAFFNNTTQAAMDGNIANTPPVIFVPSAEDRQRWEALAKEKEEAGAAIKSRKDAAQKDFDAWLATAKTDNLATLIPTEGLHLHAPLKDGEGTNVEIAIDGKVRSLAVPTGYEWKPGKGSAKGLSVRPGDSIELADVGDFEKHQAFTASAWVKTPRRGTTGAIMARMDSPANKHRGWDFWMENDRIGTHIINDWPGDALKVTAKTPLQPNQWHHVVVSYDGSSKAAGVRIHVNGVLQAVDVFTDNLRNSIRSKVPLKIGQRQVSERWSGLMSDLRLYNRALTPAEAEQLAKTPRALELLAKAAADRTPDEQGELYDWWLGAFDQPTRDLNLRLANLAQEETAMKSRGTVAHVMNERSAEPTAFILHRGEYDKRRDQVKAITPAALPPMPEAMPRNRLGLAQWLLQPEHPLTARVTVNRFWQDIFGNGLVKTAGDFGVTGELPTHPELLDWLAVEFREQGWDIRKFFKLIVTSATYRQAALVTPEKLEKDRDNRYLSRGPRYRMDAEMIRDYALAASGLLVRKIGGPSGKPYMPEGVWEAVGMNESNTRVYRADKGEKLYRRSLYTFWKRAAPPASMDILNAPNRETCTVRRERTNTPLQALLTLNDVQLVEAARVLAQKALKEAGQSDDARIDFIARRLLARPFRMEETKVVSRTLDELLRHYREKPADAEKLITVGESRPNPGLDVPTLAAWTMVVNQLMNLDEVLNK
ncbi:MAG: DUF1553 domain-containing protein [Planctomycetes bacterium]|nr:DUF1553 domain-containing protein [Planctomycetota bacterium]